MKTRFYIGYLLISLISILSAFSEDITVKNLTMQKKLSNYSVMALYQDERGLIWIGTRNGINIYDGTHVLTYQNIQSDSTSIVNNYILDIVGDKRGSVYILSRQGVSAYSINEDRYETITQKDAASIQYYNNQLLIALANDILVYNKENKKFETYYTLPDKTAKITDFRVHGDSLLVGTELQGLYIYNKAKRELSNPIKNIRISKIFADTKNNIWIGTWKNGVYKMSHGSIENFIHQLGNSLSLCSNFVRTFCEDKYGNLWVGTFRGLNRFNSEDNTFESYGSNNDLRLTNSSVWSLLCDSQGIIWVGTYFGGVNYFNPKPEVKKYFQSADNDHHQITVGAMTQDDKGNFWICTDGNGLCKLNEKSGELKWFRHSNDKNSISQNNVKSVYFDEKMNVLWIGTHMGGLNRLDLKTEHFTCFLSRPKNKSVEKSNTICDIISYKDSLLLATHAGLFWFDKYSKEFSPISKMTADTSSVDFSYDVLIDNNGILWSSGDKKGLFSYNLKTNESTRFFYKSSVHKISGDAVNCTYTDSKNRLWVCMAQTGIELYDSESDSFINYNVENHNLLNNCVYGACEIAPDKLVFIMDNGLSYFDCEKNIFRNFLVGENLPLRALNQNAIYRAKNGEIYIGGIDGMISFGPEFLEHRADNYKIFPLKMFLNDQEVKVGDDTHILKKALSVTDKITLSHDQSIFSIMYSVTNYFPSYKNELVYKLENFSDSWSVLRNQNYITYTNLNPGMYKLIVKSNSKDYVNSPVSELLIEVLPPWYQTCWAYGLYIVVVFMIFRIVVRIYKNRLRLQTELEYERKHIKDIENLNKQKLQFFTNISHEFRTPLTLIIGEVELLMQVKSFLPSVYNRILNVYKSSIQLQSLISELLDFRKQEQGHMHIKVSEHNIVKFLHENYLLFKEFSISRNIEFCFEHESDDVRLYYDEKQFQKVVNNLLSNAFKHTLDGGKICMKVEEQADQVVLTVSNTGKGIDQKDLPHLFDRFYQSEDELTSARMGAGIGLALTKGIVELHHGCITVDSNQHKVTSFIVTLFKGIDVFTREELNLNPIMTYEKQQNPEQLQEVTEMEEQPLFEPQDNKKFRVLIVEDDTNLLHLLDEIFEPYYFTDLASNAEDALEILSQNQPDIILSDVQMPGMSGLDLCKQVKREIDTCHIPVVLLTARTALEHKLEGLNTGADDYIMKPFDTNILLARCRNLINNRIMLQEKFTNQPQTTAQVFATNALDKEFMDKAMQIIEENLNNCEFSATAFAQEMAIARTKLFVKVKAITGQTPNDLIVTMRLKKAAYLLKNDFRLSVAEVSEQTGFKSPRYFSRCFKERYKVTPLNYRKGKTDSSDTEGVELDVDNENS